MQIIAAVLRDQGQPFALEPLELDDPRDHEVLVRLVGSGMCHTDLLAREAGPGHFGGPIVLGHEGAGVVEAVGADIDDAAVGDHVVLSFNSCGRCPPCTRGRVAGCFQFAGCNLRGTRDDGTTSLTDADGRPMRSLFFGQSSFATHAVAAQRSVVRVDPSLDLTMLGPLGCGIQTGAGAVFNTLGVEPGSSIVVAGAGSLGLSAIMAAKTAGATTIVAFDRHPSRLELASRYGASRTLAVGPDAMPLAIRRSTRGGADYAFDTTGDAAIVRACVEGLNNTGVLAMAGTGSGDVRLDFRSLISGRRIMGVIEGDAVPCEFIPHLLDLHRQGRFPYDELITAFPFDQINEAAQASANGEVVKPVLVF